MRIGVIGIRSKHLAFFHDSLSRLFPDGSHRITHICGFDAPELLVNWPDFVHCPDPQTLLRNVDAVILALREGYQHTALAASVLEAGKPLFVDKPFTCDPHDARVLASLSQSTGTLCTGGSTICFTEKARQLQTQLPRQTHYEISYQADPYSPYGGWYFYGSHLTDLCVSIFGTDFTSVSAFQSGAAVTAVVTYPGFTVTLRSTAKPRPCLLSADRIYTLDDRGCYDAGMLHFVAAAQGKESGNIAALVRSVDLLDGIITSLREGQPCPLSPDLA